MELQRRSFLVYAVLAALWALVMVWQVQEHHRVQASAQANLRKRSRDIADTLGAFLRGLQFRGAVAGDRLQPVLDELVGPATKDISRPGEVRGVALLNAAGGQVASAGNPLVFEPREIAQEGERWGKHTLTVVFPVEGASVTNAPILLPAFTNPPPRSFRRDGRPPEGPDTNAPGFRVHEGHPPGGGLTNAPPAWREGPPPEGPPPDGAKTNAPPPRMREGTPQEGQKRLGRPFWARGLNDVEYQNLIQKRELHGVALAMSTDQLREVVRQDLWMRCIIGFFATVAVLGSAFGWRTLTRSSDLQIRLVRASELNTHLREMNVAAAGLAHETRNPLNIIRGLAQMISKQEDLSREARERSRDIINEADKVAAQLNEFINYSRPREVRRSSLALGSVLQEVVRALNYDVQEKQVRLQIAGEQLSILADDQLLRQALFNLILNAIQAVDPQGEVQVFAEKQGTAEARIEIRDNGPGVPADQRTEIFKPYFTTQKTGTGLGLAVVQQIVLAHGWEIECLPNSPKGAVFRISHVELAAKS